MSLIIEDVQEGTGKIAEKGKDITVHYTGYLTDGTKFDSSLDRRQPLTITLGVGQVIRGWDEGFGGMKEGGKRKLTIPPEMGYGSRAVGGVIPANSTLIFEVELLRVHD
ncbi:FKBP-type peptidyl-prolyl cis-trans isomerase [Kingella kingae]|nr:FKBP-type peptidyl-prolyl cis-trans isomerase [Kingella kingae]MDK4526399.1 FKBP-type peptidyl-prolyl cis-trans isomerase [Kingella kingae]MDK4528890.1 FKBP-type peptidyl-prolyl cis-trans isomerase [Kingella kingae]MDK4532382.1 FKBP-type peptidyl-prolyl cis-trans isomerase [Kingella kingae]MDK4534495.1 FKBP-type peptidyl-prolyl cis-trans isomerase [Kingella kingae]MDK4540987.1 FKBP-type peptidyl-prolyl cis-trans isomerase [Kingella kingae]